MIYVNMINHVFSSAYFRFLVFRYKLYENNLESMVL